MNDNDKILECMVNEAITELNYSGWRDAPQNAVTLAAFGIMAQKVNKRVDRLVGPAWLIGISLMCSAIWLIVRTVLGV